MFLLIKNVQVLCLICIKTTNLAVEPQAPPDPLQGHHCSPPCVCLGLVFDLFIYFLGTITVEEPVAPTFTVSVCSNFITISALTGKRSAQNRVLLGSELPYSDKTMLILSPAERSRTGRGRGLR